jgi:hypothetical protein
MIFCCRHITCLLSCWTCCFAAFDAARSANSLARKNSIVIIIASSPDEDFLRKGELNPI